MKELRHIVFIVFFSLGCGSQSAPYSAEQKAYCEDLAETRKAINGQFDEIEQKLGSAFVSASTELSRPELSELEREQIMFDLAEVCVGAAPKFAVITKTLQSLEDHRETYRVGRLNERKGVLSLAEDMMISQTPSQLIQSTRSTACANSTKRLYGSRAPSKEALRFMADIVLLLKKNAETNRSLVNVALSQQGTVCRIAERDAP